MNFSPFIDLKAYNKLEIIGKGGFSKVVRIQNKKTGKIYAAKILFDQINDYSSEQITDISREVNILANIRHPSIIKFVGYSPINFKQTAKTTIVTEYLPYGSLYDILEKERSGDHPPFWTMTKKLINIYGIASGMSYLHSRNIIHRDLKPQNILEDEYLFPKISDFGLSKVVHQNQNSITFQSTTGIKGTPTYMSPETMDNGQYTKSGDVYSFSLIMYEIVTLQVPYDGLNFYQLLNNVPNGYRPEIDEQVPEAYMNLISRCWSNEASERPTFEEIVKELRTNRLFITEDIDEEEYNKYIEFIEENSPHNEINENISEHTKEPFYKDKDKDIKIKINKGRTAKEFFDILIQRNYVEYLPETIREIMNKIIERSVSEANSNKIYINKEETRLLYSNHSFDNTEFITLMNSFKEISIEIEYPTEEFESIIDVITKKKKEEISNIEIMILITEKFKQEFQNNQHINTIIIKSQMNEIIDSSFLNCTSLTKVFLPETARYLEKKCFAECTSLEEITFPSSISKIGVQCFMGCSSLKKITFSGLQIQNIDDQCFMNCTSLKFLEFPSSVKVIKNQSFMNCSALEYIIFPPSVRIGDKSFMNCTSLKHVSWPTKCIYSIGIQAFGNCSSLTEVELPPLSMISIQCFLYCTSLVKITIPQIVDTINDKAFEGCSSLKEIEIPSFTKFINDKAFYNCSKLEKIVIMSEEITISKSAFENTGSLHEIYVRLKIFKEIKDQREEYSFNNDCVIKCIEDEDYVGHGECSNECINKNYVISNELNFVQIFSISSLKRIHDYFFKIPTIIGANEKKMDIFIPLIREAMRSGKYLSISTYDQNSVFINGNHEIFKYPSLSKKKRKIWKQIEVTQTGRPISSVCGSSYTLYLIEKEEEEEEKYEIIYNNTTNNKKYSVPIDRRDEFQISLYGGERNAGIIFYYNEIMIFCEEFGEGLKEGEEMKIKRLPSNERCIFLACTNYSIYAQCSSGKVYSYKIKREGGGEEEEDNEEEGGEKTDEFEEVRELSGANIISISGTSEHCIAVSSTGAIYVEGNNEYGQLGFCSLITRINKFFKIEGEKKHFDIPISRVYAGKYHSFFVTKEGQAYCSGLNENGEIFMREGGEEEAQKKIYSRASSTMIKGGTKFCIAGKKLSILFINCEPSPNTPNQEIKYSS